MTATNQGNIAAWVDSPDSATLDEITKIERAAFLARTERKYNDLKDYSEIGDLMEFPEYMYDRGFSASHHERNASDDGDVGPRQLHFTRTEDVGLRNTKDTILGKRKQNVDLEFDATDLELEDWLMDGEKMNENGRPENPHTKRTFESIDKWSQVTSDNCALQGQYRSMALSKMEEYQQRNQCSSKFPLELKHYLPESICDVMKSHGSTATLYPWQAACLNTPGALNGRNIVYSAPTSGGKTLVAEILLLRRIISTRKPALFVLPFVSLCAEKAERMRLLLTPLGLTVAEFYGGMSTIGSPLSIPSTGCVIATIEKANILINSLLEEQNDNSSRVWSMPGNEGISCLSAVCVDELHLVGDADRGYQLELMLTKLIFADKYSKPEHDCNQVINQQYGIQIIGMSATLPNMHHVADWLDAALYLSDYRPIPLEQYIKLKDGIFDMDGNLVRKISTSDNLRDNDESSNENSSLEIDWDKKDPDHVARLVRETIDAGHSVIVFCGSRLACERTAGSLSSILQVPERCLPWKPSPNGFGPGSLLPQPPDRNSICNTLRQDDASNSSVVSLIESGICFHHAGMTTEERELVEIGFRCGAIRVLCATSTLATGVNLPARRVIFKHIYIGRPSMTIDSTKLRQMAGRAGRAGVDTNGEVYIVAKDMSSLELIKKLMKDDPEPIKSCLCESRRGMKRALLEVIASGAVKSAEDVDRYVRCSLLANQISFGKVVQDTKTALVWLGDKERNVIVWDKEKGMLHPQDYSHSYNHAIVYQMPTRIIWS